MKVLPLAVLLFWAALTLLPLPPMSEQLILYPWLGLFPGLAFTSWLMPGTHRVTRAALAAALSPLLSAMAGWVLMRAGLDFRSAALAVAVASGASYASAILRRRPGREEEPVALPRSAMRWAIGLGTVLLALPVLNPLVLVHSDSWLHGGVVMELLTRGMPPEDPRMAGLRLNYVWFFNLFIALLSSLRGQEPFFFMSLFNAVTGYGTVLVVALLAQRLWNSERATIGAVALLTLGLNAGAYLLWPLGLVRLFVGKVQGGNEFARIAADFQPGTMRILYSLSAPFAQMVSFLDKLTVGTPLAYAYLLMLVYLWAMLRWFGDRRRDALVLAVLSAAGMMLFHSVVGLSVIPVAGAGLAIAWLFRSRWNWLPGRSSLAAFALASGAGVLLTYPYLRSITAGWASEKSGLSHHFISFNTWFPWTLVTSCFFPLWFARRPLIDGWRQRRMPQLLIAGFGTLMIAFACVVNLPENNYVKFVFECFVPCLLLAAPAFAEFVVDFWTHRRAAAAIALPLVFAVPTLATLHGYLVDPAGATSPRLHDRPGEATADEWIRGSTPRNAVFLDRGFRDLLMVKARRRLYMGTDLPPERAAFPVAEMRARQQLIRDLYDGTGNADSSVARLRALGRPLYVLYRPEDSTTVAAPWQTLIDAAPGSALDFDHDGYRVVRLSPRSGP